MMTSSELFERSLFSLLLGLIILIISLSFYYPYIIKKKNKPIYGVKRDKRIDYLKDGIKMIAYSRLKGFIYFAIFLLILSFVFLLMAFFK